MKVRQFAVSSALFFAGLAHATPAIQSCQIANGGVSTIANEASLTNAQQLVSATVTDAEYVWAQVHLNPNDSGAYYNVYLENTGGNSWVATLPVNVVGTAKCDLFASSADEVVSTSLGSFTVTGGLSELRRPTVSTWLSSLATVTSHKALPGDAWTASKVFMPDAATINVPAVSTLPTSNNSKAGSSLIRTSVPAPIGELWFKARFSGLDNVGTLFVETSDKGRTGGHDLVATIDIPRLDNGEWTQFRLVINDPDAKYLRIRSGTVAPSDQLNINSVQITDLLLTPPAPDVVISKDQVDYEPGYPSVQDPISFHVTLSQKWEYLPATCITPKLIWRQDGGSWNTTLMTNVLGRAVDGAGTYACTIFDHEAGGFEYFYRVDFAGYAASVSFKETFGINNYYPENIDQFAWFRKRENSSSASFQRSPAYYPDFVHLANNVVKADAAWAVETGRFDWNDLNNELIDESHLFDVQNLDTVQKRLALTDGYPDSLVEDFCLEASYPYLQFQAAEGVRRFRSQFDSLGLRVEPWDESVPTGLDEGYPMQQVGDYTWQAIVRMDGSLDATFAPTGACWYAKLDDGSLPQEYAAGPFIWWEKDQSETGINPPMSGYVTNQQAKVQVSQRSSRTYITNDIVHTNIVAINNVVITNYTEVYTNYTVDFGGVPFEMSALKEIVTNYVDSVVTNFSYENDIEVSIETSTWEVTNYVLSADVPGLAASRVQLDYNGFLMYRFCTTNGSYQVRRAAWQDFNGWQADDNLWDQTYGLYDMTIFTSDLNDRDPTQFAASPFIMLEESNEADHNRLYPTNQAIDGLWLENGWVTEDWVTNSAAGGKKNRSYRLSTWKGRFDTLGSLETMRNLRSDGRDTLLFRTRVSTDDDLVAYYDADGSDSWRDYTVLTQIRATSWSDTAFPYASVYTYWQDQDNYLETRLYQKTRYGSGENNNTAQVAGRTYQYLEIEMWKCEDGVLSKIDTAQAAVNAARATIPSVRFPFGVDAGNTNLLGDGFVLGVGLKTTGNSTTADVFLYPSDKFLKATASAPCASGIIGTNSYNEARGSAVRFTIPHSSPDKAAGTIAYNVYDMAATFNPWVCSTGEAGAPTWSTTDAATAAAAYPIQSSAAAYNAVRSSGASSWRQATDKSYDNRKPWQIVAGTTAVANPVSVTRPVPTACYRVRAQRTGLRPPEQIDAMASATEWDENWDEVFGHTSDQPRVADTFDWKWTAVPMHLWDDTYVQIHALADNGGSVKSTGLLVVDDLSCDEWSGKTVYDPDYGDETRNAEESWIGTYAAVVFDGREGRRYELSRSRTDPNAIQGVTSPHLWEGVGDMLFTWEVGSERNNPDDQVAFAIQLVDDDTGAAETLLTKVSKVTDGPVSAYAPALRSGMSGRLRVVTLGEDEGSSVSGVLYVDDLRASDYPNSGDTSWEAYNVRVSSFLDNRTIKFDGRTSQYDSYRTAVLNDGTAKETVQDRDLNEHPPFIQTPAINTGVGEISFWYRAWPGNEGPAKLHLRIARTGSTPDPQWRELSVDDLYWNNQEYETADDDPDYQTQKTALEGLSDISLEATSDWKYFSCEFYESDYKLLRLYTDAKEPCRVMIDNILITEPVRSSIDVGSIEFDPGVPLVDYDTSAIVTLVNPRMDPHDIKVRLDWYVGTNVWGYENWKDSPSGSLTFTNVPNENLVFASVERIPRQPRDTVVQYAAIVEYLGRFASPICSETQSRSENSFWFTNPAWYEPVDLNKTFSTTNQPVAHFWSFTVSTNQAFVNELYPISANARVPEQFVELTGRLNGDIEDWELIHAGRVSTTLTYGIEMWTNVLDAGAIFGDGYNASAEPNKGWGFYVLGNSAIKDRNQELFPLDIEEAGRTQQSTLFMYVPGALVLKRSMGAWADRVVWGGSSGESEVRDFIEAGYTYLGSRRNGSNQGFEWRAGYDEGELRWDLTGSYTIGGFNYGQEAYIWPLTYTAAKKEKPLIDQPRITAFSLGDGVASFSFEVWTTNSVALTPTDYSWYVMADQDILMQTPVYIEIEDVEVEADAEGNPAEFSFEIPEEALDEARFWRLIAYPKE